MVYSWSLLFPCPHSFSNGALYKCSRKDTKRQYVASVRGHTDTAEKELSFLKSLQHNHILRLFDLYDGPTQYMLVFHSVSSENILQRLARKATYTESTWHLLLTLTLALTFLVFLVFKVSAIRNTLHASHISGFVTETVAQLCNAVEYLHHKDIIHGVVHPYNIVMSSMNGNRCVLTNFSQARKSDEAAIPAASVFTEFLGKF